MCKILAAKSCNQCSFPNSILLSTNSFTDFIAVQNFTIMVNDVWNPKIFVLWTFVNHSGVPANKKMLNISFACIIAASDKLIVIFKNQTK